VISGVIAARLLLPRVEGGPEVDPYADFSPSYVDSGLLYDLMYLWVEFGGLGSVYFKLTLEEIELVVEEPHSGSEPFWDSEGWVPPTRVSALYAPAPLAALVGATVTAIAPLYYAWSRRSRWWWQRQRPTEVDYIETGLILETTKGAVAIDDVGDDYAVGVWPDKERWEALGIVTEVDPRRVPQR
jgi:hypothetical protein